MNLRLGIDVGGTSTKLGVVSDEGKILSQGSIVTCENDDPDHFIERLVFALGQEFERFGKKNFRGIGVGAPNGNFYSGSIEYAPNLKWKGIVPLAQMLTGKTGFKTVLTNDANAAAKGEMTFGHAKGMKHFIILTLGTGLGSGIVANGEILYGHSGFAGELGHLVVKQDGRNCGCGRKGCLETYVSATGLVKTFQELTTNHSSLTAKEISKLALEGETHARDTFKFTGDILGRAMANMATFSSPEAIFLFGGLLGAGDLLMSPVKEAFEKNLLNVFQKTVKILPSGLPDSDAAILGAAAMIN